MKSALRFGLRALAPLVIIGIGIGIFMALTRSRPTPPKVVRPTRGPLVEVVTLELRDVPVEVEAYGTVVPSERVIVQPEITGRVVWQSSALVPGGRVAAGQPLLRIDPRNYQVSVEQQSASLNRAELDLEVERSRQVVAEREWQLFGGQGSLDGGVADGGPALALRQPQIRTAQVAVRAARSAVERASLDLQRAGLTAPFNAIVQSESVDVGQLVSAQSQIAALVGTDRFWVQVSLPVSSLQWLDVPDLGAEEGSPAIIRHRAGDVTVERSGRIVRLLSDLEGGGRMARALVEIDDPLGLKEGTEAQALPLLLGAYVQVVLTGRVVENVIEVPRAALREGDRAFVMNDRGRLEVRALTVAFRNGQAVFVREGLARGEHLVTSSVPSPVPGMELRTQSEEPSPEPRRAEARP